MKLAMVGMGRMGGNMARRLALGGHQLVAFDVSPDAAKAVAAEHHEILPVADFTSLIAALPAPRAIWLMTPHQAVDETIEALLAAGLQAGDLIIDGGNSNYHEGQRRASDLEAGGIGFADCGTSGGIRGLKNGYSLMIGGGSEAIAMIAPVLTTLAANDGKAWAHVGPVGAGHYVKMIHNGIEYGMMQAFAEGFDLMHAKSEFDEKAFVSQYESLRRALTQTRQNEVWTQYLTSLREKADIVDNRLRML